MNNILVERCPPHKRFIFWGMQIKIFSASNADLSYAMPFMLNIFR